MNTNITTTEKNVKVIDAARELDKSISFVRVRTSERFATIWNSTNNKWRQIHLLHKSKKVLRIHRETSSKQIQRTRRNTSRRKI